MGFVTNAGKATAEQTTFDPADTTFLTTTKNVQVALEEVKLQLDNTLINIDAGSPDSVATISMTLDGGGV